MSTRPYLAADDRRRALLDAADRLFERDGFQGLSMVAVAAEAGISRALLYKHFPDQASLYVAMFDDRIERFISQTTPPVDRPADEQAVTAFGRVMGLPLGELRVMRAALTGDGGPDLAPLRDRLADHVWRQWSPLFDPPRDEEVARVVMLSLSCTAIDFAIAAHEGTLTPALAERIWTATALGAVSAIPASTASRTR